MTSTGLSNIIKKEKMIPHNKHYLNHWWGYRDVVLSLVISYWLLANDDSSSIGFWDCNHKIENFTRESFHNKLSNKLYTEMGTYVYQISKYLFYKTKLSLKKHLIAYAHCWKKNNKLAQFRFEDFQMIFWASCTNACMINEWRWSEVLVKTLCKKQCHDWHFSALT